MRISAPLAASLLSLLLVSSPAARQGQPPQGQPPAPPPQPQPSTSPAAPPAGGAPPAAQEPARAQQPPIRTGINYVRVDAIITDKQGNPVLDLKPEEFQISEDNKPQKIESFSVVRIDATTQADAPLPTQIRSLADEQQEAAKPETRLFVLLLDDYHVRRGNDLAVRKPLIDFIQNQLAPADMVALMYPLTPVTDLMFSRDRAGLISAVDHFLGRKFDYQPRNEFEEKYAYYPAATVEKVRNDVTMGALKGAAVRLGGLHEGRKSIIFVSEGFTSTLPPQLNDPVAAMPRVGNPARGNAGAQGPGDTAEFFNSVDLLNDMRDVFDTANRQNTSIYAVDPRGLAAFEYDVNEAVGLTTDTKGLNATLDSLRILADNTDGRAIINRNDLAVGMKQIIRDASGYYLLGYNSTQAPTDGRFHEIKVRVTRKGVDVRARKGYYAYTADDVARASAPPAPSAPSEVTAALASIAEPPRGRVRALLDRHRQGGQRRTPRHVRLGADAARGCAGSRRRQRRGPGHAHRDRSRRPADVPGPDSRGRGGRTGRIGAARGRERGGDAHRRWGERHLRRGPGPTSAADGGREQPRPGDGLGNPGTHHSGLLEGAGFAEHAQGVQGTLGARAAAGQGEPRRGADCRPHLQPRRPAADPDRRLHRGRLGPGDVRAAPESRRDIDG